MSDEPIILRTEPVSRTATCKRCGSTDVVWQKGQTGKWYLTEVFIVDGEERTNRHDFHSVYCGKRELHTQEQTRIIEEELARKRERDTRNEERERERIELEAEKLEAWYKLSRAEQDSYIEQLEREIKSTLDGITMDYMTEYLRAVEKANAIRAEIDMFLADREDEEV